MVPTPSSAGNEAHKTEPDKNTYLVFKNGLDGADPSYDYGTHFLFQGHEGGGGAGYITRINLDADAAHRVTLMATTDVDGNPLATIDGSTWDPWAKRLLFTTENPGAPTYAATPDYPSAGHRRLRRARPRRLRGHPERRRRQHLDRRGHRRLEQAGHHGEAAEQLHLPLRPEAPGRPPARQAAGAAGAERGGRTDHLRQPGSAQQPRPAGAAHLRRTFKTRWVTIHDTAIDGNAPFIASRWPRRPRRRRSSVLRTASSSPARASASSSSTRPATPTQTSPENATRAAGARSSKLEPERARARDTRHAALFYNGDEAARRLRQRHLPLAELDHLRRGRGRHAARPAQRTRLGLRLDVTRDYSNSANQPVRWLAEGRDASATIDAANGGFGKNEGDNEITGVHVSDGDTGINGVLGPRSPTWADGELALVLHPAARRQPHLRGDFRRPPLRGKAARGRKRPGLSREEGPGRSFAQLSPRGPSASALRTPAG